MSDDREAFARASNVLDREAMAARVEDSSCVSNTYHCGPGLLVAHGEDASPKTTFTGIVEECGWYVAAYEKRITGDHIILMPLPEVEQQ